LRLSQGAGTGAAGSQEADPVKTVTSWRGLAARLRDQAACRAQGRLLATMEKATGGGDRGRNQHGAWHRPSGVTGVSTLSDLGVSKNQSMKWQQLADVPEDEFEAAPADPERPSTTGIIEARTSGRPSARLPGRCPAP
jgi:hypothetical protein